jgi:RNA polymerase sigma-70 factor (ECF subfamily)
VSDTSSFLREHPFGHTEFLVGRARGGSQTAWQELHRRYHTMLVAQLQARIPGFARRRFDAEDVLQAALIRAWQSIDSFEYRGEGSFRRWLATLVVNTFRSELEAQQAERERGHETEVEPGTISAVAHGRDGELGLERAAMLEALGQLSDEDRDILIQRHFEELSFEAIAASQGCKRERARQMYSLAFGRLQRRLRA